MKVLLVSVNASYMHTNLAIRDLKNYAEKHFPAKAGAPNAEKSNAAEQSAVSLTGEKSSARPEIAIAEYTINQPIGEVLRGIAFTNADLVLFSTYIWNAEYVCKLMPEIKKVLPECILGAGGPEFGYGAKKYLSAIDDLDFIIFGEGELTFTELIEKSEGDAKSLPAKLKDIKGIFYRAHGSVWTVTRKVADKTAHTGVGKIVDEAEGELVPEAARTSDEAEGELVPEAARTSDEAEGKVAPEAARTRDETSQVRDESTDARNETPAVAFTGNRALLENLDDIPFPYPEILAGTADPDHKIYYYESSRGCPFGCSYCLSSVDKRVRFKSLERTCSELQIFLDNNIKLVKFVDRTYNLDENRYIGIWDYIAKHHNGKTMFHFEIEAEYLSEKALAFLQNIPAGVMQFEMGVQSANKKTLAAINRSTNVEELAEKIKRIPRTIHQHLDLIAGLPYEDLESFGRSYDFVMALRPDALQLGFLKVLNGTEMEKYAKDNGWKWMESPAYETFSTPYMTFSDIAFLKDIEVVTDAYWNKGSFACTMNYVFRVTSPWAFFCALVEYGRSVNAFSQARKEAYWFELVNDFVGGVREHLTDGAEDTDFRLDNAAAFEKLGMPDGAAGDCFQVGTDASPVSNHLAGIAAAVGKLDKNLIYDLLRYDFVRTGKKGNFPAWYKHIYDKDKHRKLLEENGLLENTRIGFAITEYEEFDYNVLSEFPETEKHRTEVLVRYK
jgi:radical SAM superfamily enzyme YgiQ (UPF0313 family)